VLGLAAFAAAVSTAWEQGSPEVEGQADVHADAVTLYTMHAAKGLEWPVVIPVNTMARTRPAGSTFVARGSNRLYCPVFGVRLPGHDAALEEETAQLGHERMRLWYVAATRARELLVLPRFADTPPRTQWAGLLDLGHARLSALEIPAGGPVAGSADMTAAGAPAGAGVQTAVAFAAERQAIEARRQRVEWRTPSRSEGTPVEAAKDDGTADDAAPFNAADIEQDAITVQGSMVRGTVLHKLMEEVLTGETGDTPSALAARAALLVAELGLDNVAGLEPNVLATTVSATLALPEVAAVRARLVPEYPVWHSSATDGMEVAHAGIADAIAFDADGRPEVVIDWKSDVAPTGTVLAHYRAQVGSYLRIAGVPRGLIVLMTTGTVISVTADGDAI
jgi:ATP-dependent exoDNAse (exonuclease V) beta subunit